MPEPTIPAVIALDGPAGAGKSTAARLLAGRLGFSLLDTGAIYRGLALVARREGIGWDDAERLAARAIRLEVRFAGGAGPVPEPQRVLIDGDDVSEAIRTPEIAGGASRVSAHPAVRAALLELQRGMASGAGDGAGWVVEGRDIGTVVLPWAPVKFFVTASPRERARRRTAELRARGQAADEREVEAEIRERDARDANRAVAPMRAAEGAIVIDTSDMDIDAVVTVLEAHARTVFGRAASPRAG